MIVAEPGEREKSLIVYICRANGCNHYGDGRWGIVKKECTWREKFGGDLDVNEKGGAGGEGGSL